MKRLACLVFFLTTTLAFSQEEDKNIIFIFCDDLNRSGLGTLYNSEVITPNIDSLVTNGIAFTNAHSNAPLCGPSRASVLSGVAPTTSGHYGYRMGQNDWRLNPVLAASSSMFAHFKNNDYRSYAVGKLYHKKRRIESDFTEYDTRSERGPFAYNNQGHSDLPIEFNSTGLTFGALENIPSYPEYTGWVNKDGTPFIVNSSTDRDSLGDELSVGYAREIFAQSHNDSLPFFLTVGFRLPHHPMHIPQEYFDLYDPEELNIDQYLSDSLVSSIASFENRWNWQSNVENFDLLMGLVPETESDPNYWLKKYIQAYYASISFLDHLIGELCLSLREEGLDDNTYIVISSDHGYHLGSKRIMAKTTLWNAASGVPLIFSGPDLPSKVIHEPVSLVDIYPTIVDLAGIPYPETHNLDGESLLNVLQPSANRTALISVAADQLLADNTPGIHENQHHALAFGDYKYILYSSGEDELYNIVMDENEVLDLSMHPDFQDIRRSMHDDLEMRIQNLASPAESYNCLFYGDFNQALNGWSPSIPNGTFTPSGGNLVIPEDHIVISGPSNNTLENTNIYTSKSGSYTFRFKAYCENGEAQLAVKFINDESEVVDSSLVINESLDLIEIPFSLDSGGNFREQKVLFGLLSGSMVHLDDIEIVRNIVSAEYLNDCLSSNPIIKNVPPNSLAVDTFATSFPSRNIGCSELNLSNLEGWKGFTSQSTQGVLYTRTSEGIDPVLEVYSNCASDKIYCSDSNNDRTEILFMPDLQPFDSYRVRVGNKDFTVSDSSLFVLGYYEVNASNVIGIDNNEEFRFLTSPFEPESLVGDSVTFRFIDNESGNTFYRTLPYSHLNSYEWKDINSLKHSNYNVSVAHRLKGSSAVLPFGRSFNLQFEGMSSRMILSPNPTGTGTSVVINGLINEMGQSYLTIYDLSGRLIHKERLAEGRLSFELPASIQPGVFLVKLSDADGKVEKSMLQVN